jgi:inhibitor of KinA sporulation pathway (predicted exonuclease)
MMSFEEYIRKSNQQKYSEAIVDEPSQHLSDIFDQEGKLKIEVINTIQKGIQEIKTQFPQLPIDDYFLVGAAVTYQYTDQSDIDTTVSVPRADEQLFKQANDWIGSNLDPKYKFVQRPYQFKVSRGTRQQIAAFDAVYDVISQIKTNKPSWIKQPNQAQTHSSFKQFVANAESKERQLYSTIERTIQPSLQRLLSMIKSTNGQITNEIKRQVQTVVDRYKIIKNLRGKSYDGPKDSRDSGKISSNWGVGNVVFKFLDREGYLDAFKLIKDMVQSNYSRFNLNQLVQVLSKVAHDEHGYVHENFNIDKAIIIDVESTCDKNKEGFTNEIIEIGMADSSGQGIPSIFIKPQHSKITPFCTSLTTLTPEEIETKGQDPKEAYKKLESIVSRYNKWASYGDYDKEMFDKMNKLYGLNLKLPPDHTNIRLLFAQKILNSNDPQKAPKNPKDALEMLGKKFQGVNHRGEDDAINIANLYGMLNSPVE